MMTHSKSLPQILNVTDPFLDQWCQQSVKNITEDPTNSQLSYVSSDSICSAFEGDTLLTVQAPAGTLLEVPKPELAKYQIHLKSSDGQIYVVLVNKDKDSEEPVVMQVPPTEEELRAAKGETTAAASTSSSSTTARVRVSGRGKTKASSPPAVSSVDVPPAKRQNKLVSEASAMLPLSSAALATDADKAANKEVEGILTGAPDFPGLDDFMGTNESEFRTRSLCHHFSLLNEFPLLQCSGPSCA